MLDYAAADRMATVGDVKRSELDKKGALGRSAALQGQNAEGDTPKSSPKDNVVEQQMQQDKLAQVYNPVFDEVNSAVYAAREACKEGADGLQSEKEVDSLLTRCLNDLIAVLENIRNNRKAVIAARTSEEQSHPALVS